MNGSPATLVAGLLPSLKVISMNEASREWLEATLKRLDIPQKDAPEAFREKPWASVYRIPTAEEDLYFKTQFAPLANEARVLPFLMREFPQWLPELLAADGDSGYMLMRSAGVSLRSLFQTDKDLKHWEAILPNYAALQQQFQFQTAELRVLGAMDRRTEVLTERFAEALEDRESMLVGRPEGLTEEELHRLKDLLPALAKQCEALAGYGIPDSINHDDFHDGNIFVQDGAYRFIDWGDCCVSHPFFTIDVTLRVVANALECDENAPEICALRDLYLNQWADYATQEALREAYALSRKLVTMNRALTWRLAVRSLENPWDSEEALAAPRWARRVLERAQSRA